METLRFVTEETSAQLREDVVPELFFPAARGPHQRLQERQRASTDMLRLGIFSRLLFYPAPAAGACEMSSMQINSAACAH